jgi:hypothetical protein
MRKLSLRKRMNYRRGNGDDGYCRDCGEMREQNKLFGKPYRNCIHIGVGTEKFYHVRCDYTCDFFWLKANDEKGGNQ